MRRGDVFEARLDPIEGSEQGGTRPVVIVSRDSLNELISTVVAIPLSTHREGREVYGSRVLIRAPAAGLTRDSVVLCEQVRVLAKSRLLRQRGSVSESALASIDVALAMTLGLA